MGHNAKIIDLNQKGYVEKVKYYLDNEGERFKIVENGYKVTSDYCAWKTA